MSKKPIIDHNPSFAQSVSTLVPSGYDEYSSNMKNVVKDILSLLDRNNISTPKPTSKSINIYFLSITLTKEEQQAMNGEIPINKLKIFLIEKLKIK